MRPFDTAAPSATLVSGFQAFLRDQGLTFGCAESCTGGLLSRWLTAPAGSSDVFWGGVVTYSNQAKTALLAVSPALLELHGAVSGPVAVAMAEGLARLSGVPLTVAITGVAGPSGGTPDKPVGTVWVGLSGRGPGVSTAVQLALSGNRGEIQDQAARWALILAASWWRSGRTLDSLRAVTDNEGKPVVVASQPPSPFPPPAS